MKSTKFVTACYIMSFVAYHAPQLLTTPTIAKWVNCNASRVRQIVAQLGRAGLLASTLGGAGGVELARPAEQITLLNIFEAVQEESVFAFAVENPFSAWTERCKTHDVLADIHAALEADMKAKLARIRLDQLYVLNAPQERVANPA